jgi:hypothetical protein
LLSLGEYWLLDKCYVVGKKRLLSLGEYWLLDKCYVVGKKRLLSLGDCDNKIYNSIFVEYMQWMLIISWMYNSCVFRLLIHASGIMDKILKEME